MKGKRPKGWKGYKPPTEIDRILTRYTGRTGPHLDEVKRELSKAGVVVRVDRELPKDSTHTRKVFAVKEELHAFDTGYFACGQDIKDAGYEATKPLIENKQ